MNRKLLHCLNYNRLISNALDGLIQDIQELEPELAFFAIEAQQNLRKLNILIISHEKTMEAEKNIGVKN